MAENLYEIYGAFKRSLSCEPVHHVDYMRLDDTPCCVQSKLFFAGEGGFERVEAEMCFGYEQASSVTCGQCTKDMEIPFLVKIPAARYKPDHGFRIASRMVQEWNGTHALFCQRLMSIAGAKSTTQIA